jgi:hypothetical protein
MAGITRFIPGETAVASDAYWSVDENLCFDLHLSERAGGYDISEISANDYGSDILIDPAIAISDPVIFIMIDEYTGIWVETTIANRMHEIHRAIARCRQNRAFMQTNEMASLQDTDWLQELATQTRRRVILSNGDCIQPQPVGTLQRFSQRVLSWLAESQSNLAELNEESFECLIATLIDRMGYHVKRVGNTYRKDGGVDIVAWPESGMPYLLAIQVKYHRGQTKTSVDAVRNFLGALHTNPQFSFGLLVTNTSFTKDAIACADKVQNKVRLRHGNDVHRWLQHDYRGEIDWLPETIELGLGITTQLSRELKPLASFDSLRPAIDILRTFADDTPRPDELFGQKF